MRIEPGILLSGRPPSKPTRSAKRATRRSISSCDTARLGSVSIGFLRLCSAWFGSSPRIPYHRPSGDPKRSITEPLAVSDSPWRNVGDHDDWTGCDPSPQQGDELLHRDACIGDDAAERAELDPAMIGHDDPSRRVAAAQDHVAAPLASEDEAGSLQRGPDRAAGQVGGQL